MMKVWLVIACLCLVGVWGAGVAVAEGDEKAEAAPAEKPMNRTMLEKELRDAFLKLKGIQNKLANLTENVAGDPELVKAKKAMEDAQKAYHEKLMEKISAQPEGKKLIARKEMLEARQKEIKALLLKANKEMRKKRAQPARRAPAPAHTGKPSGALNGQKP
ncbi:hypothetical protein ACFL01_04360 [Planctomycetota bacterium]